MKYEPALYYVGRVSAAGRGYSVGEGVNRCATRICASTMTSLRGHTSITSVGNKRRNLDNGDRKQGEQLGVRVA